MKISKSFLPFTLLLLLLAACGGDSDGGSSSAAPTPTPTTGGTNGGETPEEEEPDQPGGARLVYDSELNSIERQALDDSTLALAGIDINGSSIPRFSQIFGGNRSSNVVNYFEARVNYALSASTPIESRLSSNSIISLSNVETIASNLSRGLWYYSKQQAPSDTRFRINSRNLDITSTRIGIMQFGAFVQYPLIYQLAVLVHEARHSDCTRGAWQSDIDKFPEPPVNKACGHAHEICPSGELGGQFACDAHPWGAYAIDAVYSESIAKTCSNCSVPERVLAEQLHFVSRERLLYDYNELIDGTFGAPNMSSSSTVRNQ